MSGKVEYGQFLSFLDMYREGKCKEIKGMALGHAYCTYFEVDHPRVYHERNDAKAESYIRLSYFPKESGY